jgi:hypothetical protein
LAVGIWAEATLLQVVSRNVFYLFLSSVGTRDMKIQGACDVNMNLS